MTMTMMMMMIVRKYHRHHHRFHFNTTNHWSTIITKMNSGIDGGRIGWIRHTIHHHHNRNHHHRNHHHSPTTTTTVTHDWSRMVGSNYFRTTIMTLPVVILPSISVSLQQQQLQQQQSSSSSSWNSNRTMMTRQYHSSSTGIASTTTLTTTTAMTNTTTMSTSPISIPMTPLEIQYNNLLKEQQQHQQTTATTTTGSSSSSSSNHHDGVVVLLQQWHTLLQQLLPLQQQQQQLQWNYHHLQQQQQQQQSLPPPPTSRTTTTATTTTGNRNTETLPELQSSPSSPLNELHVLSLPQSQSLPQQQCPNATSKMIHSLIQHMQELYTIWQQRTTNTNTNHDDNNNNSAVPTIHTATTIGTSSNSNSNSIDTNIPYTIMLQTYTTTFHGLLPLLQPSSSVAAAAASVSVTAVPSPSLVLLPTQSLQILQDWEMTFGGHVELSPNPYHYQLVLRHYAQHCTYHTAIIATSASSKMQQQQQQQLSSTTTNANMNHTTKVPASSPPPNNNDNTATMPSTDVSSSDISTSTVPVPPTTTSSLLLYPEAIDVAIEILEHLKQTYFYSYQYTTNDIIHTISSKSTNTNTNGDNPNHTNNISTTRKLPNLTTYHYVIRCIASAIKYHYHHEYDNPKTNNKNHNNDNKNTDAILEHPTDDQYSNNNNNNNSSIEMLEQQHVQLQNIMDEVMQEFSSKKKNNHMNAISNDDFNTFLLCLSDAIQSSRYMMSIQQQQAKENQYDIHGETTITKQPVKDESSANMALIIHQQRRREWFLSWWNCMDRGNVDVWLNLHDDLFVGTPTAGTTTNNSNDGNYHPRNGYHIIDQTTNAILQLMTMDSQTAAREAKNSLISLHREQYDPSRNNNFPDASTTTTTHNAMTAPTTKTMDDCIGILEEMTQGLIKFDDMIQSKTTLHVSLPNSRHYLRVISAWSYFWKQNRAIQRQYLYTALNPAAATTPCYETMIQQQQDMVLQRLYDQHHRNHALPKTDIEHANATESWNQLMRSYLLARHPDKVLELWQHNADVEYGRIRRNQESYDVLFLAYGAKRKDATKNQDKARERAQQAHSTLNKLISYAPQSRKFEPTSGHFQAVMEAWSKSYDFNAAIYCQQVFDRMLLESERIRSIYGPFEDIRDGSIDTFVPNEAHFIPLLISWGYSRLPEATKRIIHIYSQMKHFGCRLNQKSYSVVAFALSRTKSVEGAERAEEILNRLEEVTIYAATSANAPPSIDSKNIPDRTGVNDIIDTEHDYNLDDDNGIGISESIYRSCMFAWCNSGSPNAYIRCSEIFRKLLLAYEKSGWNISLRPESSAYSTLIDSMTLDGGTVDKREAAVRAEKLLEQLEAQAAVGLAVYPNVRVYTAVMKAHNRSRDPDGPLKIENLVRRMKAAYEAGNIYAKPDGHAMAMLIQSWGMSNAPNKAAITWGIHKQMQDAYDRGDLDMQPNSYSLVAVIKACAKTSTSSEKEVKSEVVKIALMALNDLDKITDGCLNEAAFRNTFFVITNLIDDRSDRTLHAQVVFQRCCEAGFVTDEIIRLLRKHVPSIYYKLPKNPDQKLILPKSWSKNVGHDMVNPSLPNYR